MQYVHASNCATRGVSHCGFAIYIKMYLKAKNKNYENSNISTCNNIIFKESSKRNQNPFKILL